MTETETTRGATVRTVAPLLVVNALTVYGQLAYAMDQIAPAGWVTPARVALSVGYAVAVESVSLYVQWHAHDALLLKSHSTARALRRWSFLIAAAVGAMNYSHFADAGLAPTAAAVAFGMLSLLSPWMWGLHSRRAARIQLLRERRVDDAGAEFSSARKRAFPIRSLKAYRWSIDHGVTDPREAWDGYHGRTSIPSIASVHSVEVPSTPSTPVRRAITSSVRPSAWDVEKCVQMILDGRDSQAIMDASGVTSKPLQLCRRIVRQLQDGLDVDAVAARVPTSIAHIQRIKEAMS